MWYKNSIFYQIYPFGFCGAPDQNDGVTQNRIHKVIDWIPHLKATGIDAVYLCPIFESDAHGYDTRDYRMLDCRLGTNEDFAQVCQSLHRADIRVVLDGVFNHVGRGFWAFRDVQEKREASPYKDWFHIDFSGNSNYDDGFWYEGWEGHYNLVKLNLHNPEVVEHLFSCIRQWIADFDIDGLRLDVAYMLDHGFLRRLRSFCKSIKQDFFLLGEAIHGDYNQIVNDQMLDSCTNYECFKGLYSSFNDANMFEIAYSLNRQFGQEHWTLYKGLSLFAFADNHDVNRLASTLKDPCLLKPAYGLLFTMPGIPCIYYGSEWGAEGEKRNGSDDALRPCFEAPVENELTEWISFLSRIRSENPAFAEGDFQQLHLTNQHYIFSRTLGDDKVITAINAGADDFSESLPLSSDLIDLEDGTQIHSSALHIPAYSAKFYRLV